MQVRRTTGSKVDEVIEVDENDPVAQAWLQSGRVVPVEAEVEAAEADEVETPEKPGRGRKRAATKPETR